MQDDRASRKRTRTTPPGRVLGLLAFTWVLMMIGIYWIIRTGKW